ncbi:TPA: hypothetical protein DIV45_01955 [Patescibacteria group bacterium]|uniref:Uncharacterized protein n=1 Tax=candidate division Kazan bacterium GW2011_GWA1_44_22 TaxID=1620410 RepID=A0A0G1K9G2_UNCK3|nr:MAG: hypothetical protein VE96_C0006G0004 [candidate division Kazan bacterium GW2011_GWA1_44_22]HCR42109.1 hypothetical protein [Patescibacteria group bacterium]
MRLHDTLIEEAYNALLAGIHEFGALVRILEAFAKSHHNATDRANILELLDQVESHANVRLNGLEGRSSTYKISIDLVLKLCEKIKENFRKQDETEVTNKKSRQMEPSSAFAAPPNDEDEDD